MRDEPQAESRQLDAKLVKEKIKKENLRSVKESLRQIKSAVEIAAAFICLAARQPLSTRQSGQLVVKWKQSREPLVLLLLLLPGRSTLP